MSARDQAQANTATSEGNHPEGQTDDETMLAKGVVPLDAASSCVVLRSGDVLLQFREERFARQFTGHGHHG